MSWVVLILNEIFFFTCMFRSEPINSGCVLSVCWLWDITVLAHRLIFVCVSVCVWAVVQEVKGSSTNRNISCSIPGSFCPCADVSLGKIAHLLMAVYDWVCE